MPTIAKKAALTAAAGVARRTAARFASTAYACPAVLHPEILNRAGDVFNAAAAKAETAATGRSRSDYWAVDEWVGRTLPDVLLAVSKSLPYLLASAVEDVAPRLNLLKNEDIIITDDERFARQYGVRSPDLLNATIIDTSFAWLADAAPAILAEDPTGAARAWFGTLAAVLHDLHTNLHGYPYNHPDYPEPDDWAYDIARLAETAEMYEKTGDPVFAAEVFAWFSTGKIRLLWD